jgi:hypothetical protein
MLVLWRGSSMSCCCYCCSACRHKWIWEDRQARHPTKACFNMCQARILEWGLQAAWAQPRNEGLRTKVVSVSCMRVCLQRLLVHARHCLCSKQQDCCPSAHHQMRRSHLKLRSCCPVTDLKLLMLHVRPCCAPRCMLTAWHLKQPSYHATAGRRCHYC